MLDKKAQIGETMTWVVATIVIIVILIVSVVIVSSNPFKAIREFKQDKTSDLLVTKSFVGYLLTREEGETENVFEQIKDKKTYLDAPQEKVKIDKTFPKKIFLDLYKDYSAGLIFLGVSSEECAWNLSIKASPCGISNTRVLLGQKYLVPGKKATKLFYDNINLKDWGHPTKNTILELMLN